MASSIPKFQIKNGDRDQTEILQCREVMGLCLLKNKLLCSTLSF
ncbi:unnamed protein product [Meloidogyne enterolobii]|uniref:Uncharacterized protein n=1 Tax=Meloidogyne enterolobii TaxID=390850 RepID=A0ACB1A568_MELEN